MDSQQCLIQCPNCQPIQCPINSSQGLYLLPATAYNTIDVDTYIDVDQYIERDKKARFAAAALALAANNEDKQATDDEYEVVDNYAKTETAMAAQTAIVEQSEQADLANRSNNSHGAKRSVSEQANDDDSAERSVYELSEQPRSELASPPTPKHSNVSCWASTNRFAALASFDDKDFEPTDHTRTTIVDPPELL
jgi:hypothetical protein